MNRARSSFDCLRLSAPTVYALLSLAVKARGNPRRLPVRARQPRAGGAAAAGASRGTLVASALGARGRFAEEIAVRTSPRFSIQLQVLQKDERAILVKSLDCYALPCTYSNALGDSEIGMSSDTGRRQSYI
jgi:hypothetical protein